MKRGKRLKQTDVILMASWCAQLLEQGIDPRQALMTLGDWFDQYYLPSIQKTHRSWPSSLSRFNVHLRPVLGERSIALIRSTELRRLIDGLAPSPQGHRQLDRLAASTVNRTLALVKTLFATLLAWGVIQDNPAKGLKLRRERNRRVRVLREEEYAAFFTALSGAPRMVQLLIWLLLLTGMRLSEALTARWEHVDRDQRLIALPETKAGVPRAIPLSDQALQILQALEGLRVNAWLFPGRGDGHLSRPTRHFRSVLAAAGLQGLWIHDLRRTFATAAAQHVPIQDVSRCLGHASIEVTERYLVTADARLQATAAAVGRQLHPALTQNLLRHAPPVCGEERAMT